MISTELSEEQQLVITSQEKFSCFSTKNYHITATRLLKTLHTPVEKTTQFNAEVAEYFKELKQYGCENLILIGAIPFDISQNCTLNFYADFQKTEKTLKESVTQQAPVSAKSIDGIDIIQKKTLIQRQKFENTVQMALDAFDREQLKKVVLSQAIEYEFDQKQQPEHLSQTLSRQNPYAYNFVIPVEQNRYIFGASPELLLSKQDRLVCSNPLAGSRPRSFIFEKDTIAKQELQASEKDQHEHQIVVENILKNLVTYCIELKVSESPDILETSTMLHLSSNFQGILKKTAPNVLNLALELHPTPAVCGTPTEAAKQFILDHEGYDRDYYTGLVGWMDAEGNGEWVVTIRCGLLSENKMRLYAGAGIVKGSEADKEWFETEAKMQTMLNVFQLH